MITRLLIYIKHNLAFLWRIIEWINGFIFKALYGRKFRLSAASVIISFKLDGFSFRFLSEKDLELLNELICHQSKADLEFFRPHDFDNKSLLAVIHNPAFLMMGAFEGNKMVGYFFLRCFWNRNCFVGRLVDSNYQGKGIGRTMNDIMYNIAWGAGFRCLSTISRNNRAVMTAHAKNEKMVILKELDNNYLLVEFLQINRS